jgi:deoxyribodipyrimidine photolyase-related protein
VEPITGEVTALVKRRFPNAPNKINSFQWPVTPAQAKRALDEFIKRRLRGFGTYEDAMWAGEPVLYHSRLSPALNLKLLHPRSCGQAALDAYDRGGADINDVEAFLRQIIGWREYIRGIYYREGKSYTRRNALGQHGKLLDLYWTGDTDMSCLRNCLQEVIENAGDIISPG